MAQRKSPKARATKDAKKAGTKMVASDAGLGAGASAAVAFCMVEKAIKTTIKTAKTFIFIASIFVLFSKERRTLQFLFEMSFV